MGDSRMTPQGPMSPPEPLDVRVRQPFPSPPGCDLRVRQPLTDLPSPPGSDRRTSHYSRPHPIPLQALPSPITMSPLGPSRPTLIDLHEDERDDPRISFHDDQDQQSRPMSSMQDEDFVRQRHSRPGSCKSSHDECILPPNPFERPGTASGLDRDLERLDRDIDQRPDRVSLGLDRDIDPDDPYPSLQHVRTSASGLLRCGGPDDDDDDDHHDHHDHHDHPERGMVTLNERDSQSQCRLLPSPYPYWGDEEDIQSPPQKDPFVGLQKQMKIMNRNLSGKLEQELHGINHVDTHVALSEIRGQLHELTRSVADITISVESCHGEVHEVKRDMIAMKHEIDSVQLVKDEIDDIRESLDRLEADSQRRKAKLLDQQGLTFFLAYSIFSAVLGMLQFGYNTGVINAPEQVIEKFIRYAYRQRNGGVNMTYKSSTFMYAIAVSIFAIGGMCGGFCGGWIANRFGRKGGLLVNNVVGIGGACCMVFSKHITSYELLIIGRYLIGVNCGLNTSLVPMYISEIAPLNLRGGLGTVNQLAVTVGLLTSQVLGVESLLGTDNGWPYLLGIAVFPSILQMILLPMCPESPRYLLITKGQEQQAREALKRLRNQPNIEDDIEEMRAEEQAQQAESHMTMFELLRSPTLRMPLTIAVVMQLSQQLSGINAVFYYSTNLFITTGLSETSAKYATIGIGTVMVFMTLVSIPLMDRSGRRTLHLYGLGGMFIFSIFITISFLVKELVSWIWWLSVVSTLFYVVFFAVGPGSIPWMITAELFSQGPRPAAMSVAVLINWCANFLVGIGFPTMQTTLENYTFLPFSVFLAIFWVFTYKKVPETKNKTFDEIATLFRIGHKQKNLVNCVNNIAQINNGHCNSQPPLSIEEKKHDMGSPHSGQGILINNRVLSDEMTQCRSSSPTSTRSPSPHSHSPRSRSPRSPRSRSPGSARSRSPGSPQSQNSEISKQESCHSRASHHKSPLNTLSRSRSPSPPTPHRLSHNCVSPPLYPRNFPFPVEPPRPFPDGRYPH